MVEKQNEKKVMSIVSNDGAIEDVEVILAFEFKDTNKEYVVYTKNEKDQNGNITIYVTEVVTDIHGTRFLGVSTDEEWARIKDVLRELAKREA